MGKYFYTLWKAKEGTDDEDLLLDNEPLFHTKHRAFKRAHALAKDLAKGWNYVILVRRVSLDSDMCLEWVFPPE